MVGKGWIWLVRFGKGWLGLGYSCIWQKFALPCKLPAPSYLSSMCQPVSVKPGRRCLRSAARGDLVVPATRTVCYGPRSFAIAGPATWNSLPASVRDDQLSVPAFRRLLKTELTRAYDSSLARS